MRLWQGEKRTTEARSAALRYAISDFGAEPATTYPFDAGEARRIQWRTALHRWLTQDVALIQLREKDLQAGELLKLAREGVRLLTASPAERRPLLLINGRPDIAAAAGADGVHLSARRGELKPEEVRAVFRAARVPGCVVSVSTHSLPEVEAARENGADLVLFGPVFEKRVGGELVVPGKGLRVLEEACNVAGALRVLALGGVHEGNAKACLQAGAAGVAAIRLFA